ncbi:spore cortex protein [Neisseria chenwenguii]|uniref:Spore cortex protein n=1 Tax=Neisseria chenwenguii TaxID=1853278 RepID=A0A220S1I7_9NEIS|nr:spore cortex protein [Neisseria chenwenguii]ASK27307.1 spore cortex protein [Neisseria chenwenguii]ROV57017.1 spore cortex protein [Neisseria chenwenguii]
MRYLLLALAAATALAGCTWETYQKPDGHTALRQKYAPGTRVVYQDGTYSRNMRYNQFRPEQRAIQPDNAPAREVRGTHWNNPEAAPVQ